MKKFECLNLEDLLKEGNKYFFVASSNRTMDIFIGEKGFYKIYGTASVPSINGTNTYVVHYANERPSRETVENIMYELFPHVYGYIMQQMP